MIEVLEFIFRSFWTYAGFFMILSMVLAIFGQCVIIIFKRTKQRNER